MKPTSESSFWFKGKHLRLWSQSVSARMNKQLLLPTQAL